MSPLLGTNLDPIEFRKNSFVSLSGVFKLDSFDSSASNSLVSSGSDSSLQRQRLESSASLGGKTVHGLTSLLQ